MMTRTFDMPREHEESLGIIEMRMKNIRVDHKSMFIEPRLTRRILLRCQDDDVRLEWDDGIGRTGRTTGRHVHTTTGQTVGDMTDVTRIQLQG
jgi:hypothetical protein